MSLMANFKAQRALTLQTKGRNDEALALYNQAYEDGMNQPRCLLAYATLLIRNAEFEKAKGLLLKTEKLPGITPDQKKQLFMDYAVCCYKLGEIDKGIRLLERQHQHSPSGMIYETLGYLYVEKYDLAHKPSLEAWMAAQPKPEEPAPAEQSDDQQASGEGGSTEGESEEPAPDPAAAFEAEWQEGLARAQAYIDSSVEYDDEDSICLDNAGQFFYRCLDDKARAKEYFDKAIEIREGQIDTLWFLSRYDLEAGKTADAVGRLEKALEGRFSTLNYRTRAEIEAELKRLKGQA